MTDPATDTERRERRLLAYAELRAVRPELFVNPPDGDLPIEFGAAEQDEVACAQQRAMREAGRPAEGGDVGVVYQDEYLLLVRDAVRFPGGRLGSYIRIVPAMTSGGSVILPLLDDGLLLVRHFRHATRSWLWEAPRGFPEPHEDGAQTGERELREELQVVPADLLHLGTVHPDSGISASTVEIFAARVTGTPVPQAAENISEIRHLTWDELDQWIASGQITDAFTLAACALARSHGLIGPTTHPKADGGRVGL